ncbi:MAG: DUF493 domain-containing protein [Crocinitomicaceae bacterium]|nr:DUF493 domain-containing protein [Crocinitomicaceae bacterium]
MSDPYLNLREQLDLLDWPDVYLFKFIIPNNPEAIAKTSALFDDAVELQMQPSKTGKYVSISAKEMMLDVDSIIDKYNKSSSIEGLMAL